VDDLLDDLLIVRSRVVLVLLLLVLEFLHVNHLVLDVSNLLRGKLIKIFVDLADRLRVLRLDGQVVDDQVLPGLAEDLMTNILAPLLEYLGWRALRKKRKVN